MAFVYKSSDIPFLHVAANTEAAVAQLKAARQYLETLRVQDNPVADRRALLEAEAIVIDCIRIVAANYWGRISVATTGPPIVDDPPVRDVESAIVPLGYLPSRNRGSFFCPWEHQFVNHSLEDCRQRVFWESIGVSINHLNPLGIRHHRQRAPPVPGSSRHRYANRGSDTPSRDFTCRPEDPRSHSSSPSSSRTETTRGTQNVNPGDRDAPKNPQQRRNKPPHRFQDSRSRSPQYRQSLSPRRKSQHSSVNPSPTLNRFSSTNDLHRSDNIRTRQTSNDDQGSPIGISDYCAPGGSSYRERYANMENEHHTRGQDISNRACDDGDLGSEATQVNNSNGSGSIRDGQNSKCDGLDGQGSKSMIEMSNPTTTRTREALWDERTDLHLDPDMAALYALNAQHEISRLGSAAEFDAERFKHVRDLNARYRAWAVVIDTTIARPLEARKPGQGDHRRPSHCHQAQGCWRAGNQGSRRGEKVNGSC